MAGPDVVRADTTRETLPPVEVVGITSLPETGTPASQVPANVKRLRTDAPARQALDLSDLLNRGVGSVNIDDTTGNPFQPDVNYRGFTASPVLGTPQGISVFLDGARINEPFGDTVNWDLIPASAIAAVTLMPGSSPVFGLNTLGGALSVRTKDGFSHPGTSMTTLGGSFGRRAVEVESGGHGDRVAYFLTGQRLREGGWGDHNPSSLKQLFGKASLGTADTDADLSVSLADNRLEGNQTLPLSFLSDRRQAYTYPDYQVNRLIFVNATFSHALAPELRLSGNLYFRKFDSHVVNSNVNDDFDPGAPAGAGNEPTGNAINRIAQYRPGTTLQLTSLRPVGGHANHLVLGFTHERAHVDFTQFEQESGSSRDTSSTSPATLQTSLRSTSSNTGVFATDNLTLNRQTFVSVSARYDAASIRLRDRLGTALDGDHAFRRLNTAAGLTYHPTARLTTFVSYSQGMRVPSPVELSCADPDAPCSLPNAFSSDPDLRPVLSRTFEVGARGDAGSVAWSASVFRTALRDDIQFISSGGATSAGYFRNVGETRRQGVELALDRHAGSVTASAQYTYLAATFRAPLILNSPHNSSASPLACATCTDIAVSPGDRIPGIPHHLVKLRLDYAPRPDVSFGLDLLAQSSVYARGDENNQDGRGPIPGYAVWGLDARYLVGQQWEFFVKATNVLGRRYSTFGVLGRNVFTGPGRTFDTTGSTWRAEQFRSAGIPRGLWLGVTFHFDASPRLVPLRP